MLYQISRIIFITAFAMLFFQEACSDESSVQYTFNKIESSFAHVLTFDPTEYDLTPITASSIRGNRKETVKSIAKNTGAIAAINGGFFHLNSSAAGILKISGHWLGIAYRPRAAVGWNHKGKFIFGFPDTKSSISTDSGILKINSMNNTKAKSKPILFSEPLHRQDTISHQQACYIAFKGSKLVKYSTNALDIPDNGYVYYSPDKSICTPSKMKGFQHFKLDIDVFEGDDKYNWNNMPFIIGGAPMLVMNGKLADFTIQKNKVRKDFFYDRHGRTAVGELHDGRIILVIIEEDPFEKNSGVSIPKLAEYMLSLGCKHAINLDGGSSTSMFIDKKIVKHSVSKGYASFNLVSNALILSKKG